MLMASPAPADQHHPVFIADRGIHLELPGIRGEHVGGVRLEDSGEHDTAPGARRKAEQRRKRDQWTGEDIGKHDIARGPGFAARFVKCGDHAILHRIGASGKTLVIDVTPEEGFAVSARNIDGVRLVASNRVTARDVIDTTRVVATKNALEKLQEALG